MGTPRVNNPNNKGTEVDNGGLGKPLHPVRSTWTSRTKPFLRSLSYLSSSNSSILRTGVKMTVETPETTRSITEVDVTNNGTRTVGVNDPLVDSTETGTTDRTIKTDEEKEEREHTLKGDHRVGRTGRVSDQPLIPDVGNKDTTIFLLNVQNSKDVSSVRGNISLTSAQKKSNEKHQS